MATINWSLQHKRDTAANWTANNPTLLAGQIGIETDNLTTTPKFKIGDGSTAWSTLPYFYGGALSAQNLSNVLSVGNTTGGLNLVVTNNDIIQIGTTANRYIGFSTATVTGGLEIVNLNSNDHIILQDSGGIHIDTSKVILEQLTASRILSLNANKEIVNETGTGFLKLTAGVISYDNSSYQPLDSDLTSWAGVTRASGFDTFVATPSSANLASLVTDETGSGALVFGTSPTFTTDITTPKINGVSGNILLTNAAQTSGAITNFTFTNSVNTGQTASTEISNFKVNGASKTWEAGAITTQRWNYFTANTAAFASASTITNSYGLYVEAATAGTNATITNNYAAGFSGSVQITNVGTSGVILNLDGTNATGGSTSLNIIRATTGVSAHIIFATTSTNQWTLGLSGSVGTNDFVLRDAPRNATRIQVLRNTVGQIGLQGVTPTALLTLAAGTTAASTAPLKFTTGTNLTTAEVGAMEYNNTFHLTNSDATRRHVVLAPNTTKVTAAAPYVNDGYIVINIGGTDFKVMTTA